MQTTLHKIFKQLWEDATGAKIYVSYRAPLPDEAGLAGGFRPDPPRICLFRDPPPSPHDKPELGEDALSDMITLAHEYGHFLSRSDLSDAKRKAYDEANVAYEKDPAELTPDQRARIMEEERRAWDFGGSELQKLDFQCWADLATHRVESLREYERRMTK